MYLTFKEKVFMNNKISEAECNEMIDDLRKIDDKIKYCNDIELRKLCELLYQHELNHKNFANEHNESRFLILHKKEIKSHYRQQKQLCKKIHRVYSRITKPHALLHAKLSKDF